MSNSSNAATSTSDQIGGWCSQMPGVSLDHTFGPEVDVYRVDNKIFAMVNTDEPGYVTLKALPEEVLALLDQYDDIRPGYHMNKRHWITIDLSGDATVAEIPDLIVESHRLVVASLPKKRQVEIYSA